MKLISKFEEKPYICSILIAITFLCILLIGCINGKSYGAGMDQLPEQDILFMNLKSYAELILGADNERTLMLGDRDVTTDIERDHGAAPMYIAAPFTISNTFRENTQNWIVAYRVCVFLIFWFGLIAIFFLIKKITESRLWAITSVFALWLSPRFFAESTYNNKDAVALACVLISLFFGYMFFTGKEKDFVFPFLFGAATAFSTNARITGIIVLGLVGLIYIYRLFRWDKWTVGFVARGIEAIISFALVFYIITPAMWHGNVISFIKYVTTESTSFSRWSNYIAAAGEIFHTELRPAKWWYSLSYMAVTIPTIYVLLIVIGTVLVVVRLFTEKDEKKAKDNLFVFSGLLFCVIILVYIIACHSIVYNGWRQLYSLYGPLLVLALYTAYCFSMKKKAVYCVIALQICICLGFIIKNRPFEFAYFNILAGNNVEEKWDGDYWGIAAKAVLEDLYSIDKSCSVWSTNNVSLVLTLPYCNEEIVENVEVTDLEEADYIALNRTYAEYYRRSLEEDWMEMDENTSEIIYELLNTELVKEIKTGNCVLWSIYENPYK